VSKSAGAGFPVSAVVTSDAIADEAAAKVGSTWPVTNPILFPPRRLSATIDIVREEGLVEKAANDGLYFLERLQALKAKYPILIDVRGLGLMIGAEIGNVPGHSGQELCALIVALCEARGVHLTYTYFEPVIRFLPALTISRQEIDLAVSVLDESIALALEGNVTLESLMPINRYSRTFVERLRVKKTIKRLASRLYQTSPKYWMKKLKEVSGN